MEGKPLTGRDSRGGLPLAALLKIAIAISDAIAAAQQRGITHRDLKPANVMVTDEGRVKVLDFGVGEAPRSGDRRSRRGSHAGPHPPAHRRRQNHRHHRLHVARTGRRQASRFPFRHLCGRRAAARDGHRRSSLQRGHERVDHLVHPQGQPGAGNGSEPGAAGGSRAHHPPMSGQGSGPPVSDRNRSPQRPRRSQTGDVDSGVSAITTRHAARPRASARWVPLAAIALIAVATVYLLTQKATSTPAATFAIDHFDRLTTTGTVSLAAISPDGKYVVHVKGTQGIRVSGCDRPRRPATCRSWRRRRDLRRRRVFTGRKLRLLQRRTLVPAADWPRSIACRCWAARRRSSSRTWTA